MLPIDAIFKIVNDAIDVGLCDKHKSNTCLTDTIELSSSFSSLSTEITYISRMQAQPKSIISLDPIKKSDTVNNGIMVLNTNITPAVAH